MLGGILAMRLKYRGVRAVVAHGRVRDVAEIRDVELPVWSLGTSTVGSGGGVKAHAVDVAVEVGGVAVRAGDVVFADPGNGVVVIPAERVGEVLALLPKLGEADEKVKEAVRGGMGVGEAFKRFRN
jgi:regulator of RNase E activity RraA